MVKRAVNEKLRRHDCKVCGAGFIEYQYLKEHFQSVHELEFKKIKKFIEDSGHIGEINE